MKVIGLDVGTKRIGIAKADTSVKIATPDGFIFVNGQEFAEIAKRARTYNTNLFVLGLPRSNEGNETEQSAYVRQFARQLAQTIPHAKIRFQDESLTSVEAEQRIKARKKSYDKGEIDAEAAAIILQDFIEQNGATAATAVAPQPVVSPQPAQPAAPATKAQKSAPKAPKKSHKVLFGGLITLVVLGILAFLAFSWYTSALQAVYTGPACPADSQDEGCIFVQFTVGDSETVSQIADNLQHAGLIKSALAFKLYFRFYHPDQPVLDANGNEVAPTLKSGDYEFRRAMSTPEIIEHLIEGVSSSNVFNFTILPGEDVATIKQKLKTQGYSDGEIEVAFSKIYDHPVLKGTEFTDNQPASVRLEGYLYGETYQFYNGETVENIVLRTMDELWQAIVENDLETGFAKQGLSLREGIILASIVQKEANPDDQPGVAGVFLYRLRLGMALGSDVTATYAANLLDPARLTYTDNALVLDVDSLYNTRKYAGLPPGPISSPSLSALQAVANPIDSSYLYFLTGDDGKMYYSYTEAEHNQNARLHCAKLCNAAL